MTYEEALAEACRVYGLDGHQKEIRRKSECHTYAEKIADSYTSEKKPYHVMKYLNSLTRLSLKIEYVAKDEES